METDNTKKWDSQNAFAYVEKSVEKQVREEEQAKMLEEKCNIARELVKLGVPINNISKATGLSIEEIEKL